MNLSRTLVAMLLAMTSLYAVAAPTRIDTCLKTKNCSFGIFGAGGDSPQMNFWVHEPEWAKFSKNDKSDLRNRLDKHVRDMRRFPAVYAQDRDFGARVPPWAPAYSMVVASMSRAAPTWRVLVCDRKNEYGALTIPTKDSGYLSRF